MNVLITHFHSLQNAGDAAGLQVSLAQLRQSLPAARFFVVSDYPEESGYAAMGVTALASPAALARARRGWKPLKAAFQAADVIVQVSGNQLFSIGRLRIPLLLACAQIWLAGRCGAPYYLLPCSLGPFNTAPEAALVRALLRRARRVYLREPVSLRLAQSWDLPARLAADPAFLLPAAPAASAREVLRAIGWRPGPPALGLSLIPRMTRRLNRQALDRQRQAAAAALSRLTEIEPDLQLIFFPQVCGPTLREDDRQAARGLLEILPERVKVLHFPAGCSPAVLKAGYGQMQALLAGRLHAALMAFSSGVPPLMLGYLTKTRGMAELLGWQEWLVDLSDSRMDALSQLLLQFWEARSVLGRRCGAAAEVLTDSARIPFNEIAADIKGG